MLWASWQGVGLGHLWCPGSAHRAWESMALRGRWRDEAAPSQPGLPPGFSLGHLGRLSASKPLPPAPAPDEYLVSPITGEKIPASKMQEHMRIGLLDPRWLEQRDRSIREKQSDDEVYAPGKAGVPHSDHTLPLTQP